MSESPASTDDLDERVMVYVERISALQKTIQELNGELNRLRQFERDNVVWNRRLRKLKILKDGEADEQS